MWWGNTETLLHITGLAKKPMETGQTTHLSWQTTYEWTRCATRKKFLFVRYISWFYLCLWVTFYITCQFYYNFIINRQGNERIISASTENIFLQIVKSYRKNLSYFIPFEKLSFLPCNEKSVKNYMASIGIVTSQSPPFFF